MTVITRIAHVVGSNIHVVLDGSMEAVLGIANSYEEAASIAQTIEIRNQNFNFDEVYAHYPLKKGKTMGLKWLKRHVRSQSRYDLLVQAVFNFRKEVAEKGTEPQFIPHFSTWVKRFDDYIDENMATPGGNKMKDHTTVELNDDDVERLLLGRPSPKLL